MFGYIKLNKPECKFREYEYYRGIYCGLCRALGGCGMRARFTLSYDATFLALVRIALEGEKPRFYKKRCIAHPFRRHTEAVPCEALTFCAHASILLSYRKLLDDLADERGGKRLAAKILRSFFRRCDRRARRGYEALLERIDKGLAALTNYEKAPTQSLDRPAALFGAVMAEMLSFGLADERARVASAVGMAVGKWVYLNDALDDYEEDMARARYNPLLTVFGNDGLSKDAVASVELALKACLTEAENALDLIEFPDVDIRALVLNILRFGMPEATKQILRKKETHT